MQFLLRSNCAYHFLCLDDSYALYARGLGTAIEYLSLADGVVRLGGRSTTFHKFPELSAKKMDETNALPEPAQKLHKMTILLIKVRLFSLDYQSYLSCVHTHILPLKMKR